MVRLIVESPLANNQVRASVLDALDHLREFRLFVLSQLFVLLHASDVELVLRLRPRGLERTCEDGDLGVFDAVWHLRMRHVFVDEDTLDERCVSKRPADFAVDLDEVKWDVLALEIGHGEDGVYGDLSKLLVLF